MAEQEVLPPGAKYIWAPLIGVVDIRLQLEIAAPVKVPSLSHINDTKSMRLTSLLNTVMNLKVSTRTS